MKLWIENGIVGEEFMRKWCVLGVLMEGSFYN